MTGLKHPFPAVRKGTVLAYGGRQQWLEQSYMQKSACGVISCTDLLLYLHRWRPGCRTEQFVGDVGDAPVPLETYSRWVKELRNRYFPVIPYVGTIGWELTAGLNRYFGRYDIPLRARWGVRRGMLWRSMEAMLDNDLPVILAVGPNFPIPAGIHKLNFYRTGQNVPGAKTSGHFVTVTGMDGEWLWVSSWGGEYRIRRQELWDYAQKYSTFYTSSILWIWPK